MTSDTLQAHIRAYRAGTISLTDHSALVEELVFRGEREVEARADAKKRLDEMVASFLEMMFNDD